MKFEEVLPALGEGKKIKRKIWGPDQCMWFNDESLNSDDWEIVEDKKEKLKELLVEIGLGWPLNESTRENMNKIFEYIDTLEIK